MIYLNLICSKIIIYLFPVVVPAIIVCEHGINIRPTSPAVAIVIVPQRKRAAVAGVMFVFFMMIPLNNLPTAEAKAPAAPLMQLRGACFCLLILDLFFHKLTRE